MNLRVTSSDQIPSIDFLNVQEILLLKIFMTLLVIPDICQKYSPEFND